jgi:hypothetical protein
MHSTAVAAPTITTMQAEAIYRVRMDGHYEVGSTFTTASVFPPDSAANNALRAVVVELVKAGIIGKTEETRVYRITEATVAAWDAWYKKVGWKRDLNKWRYE